MIMHYVKTYGIPVILGAIFTLFKWQLNTEICGVVPGIVLVAVVLTVLGGYSWIMGYGARSESDRVKQKIGMNILQFTATFVLSHLVFLVLYFMITD